jgi:hypothetical protein
MATSRTESSSTTGSTHVQAGSSLWTLRKNGRSIECAVHYDTGSVEVQIWRDGELCAGAHFDEFAQAFAHGHALLLDLQATGWQSVG